MAKRIKSQVSGRLILIALLVIAVAGWLLWRHNHKALSTIPSSKAVVTQPQGQVSQTSPSSGETVSPKGSTTGPGVTSSGSGSNDNATLIAPYGTLVSNHHPASGDKEQSICNTSPGASCYIQFTNGSDVKKLDSQTIGDSGSVIWTWNPSDIGSGTWEIKAIASLNGQTKTTTDQSPLEVQ